MDTNHSMSLVDAGFSIPDMTVLIKKISNRRCDKKCNQCQDYSCPINPHYTGGNRDD